MGASDDVQRAIELLGPLEGRIMSIVWSRQLPDRFVVRDVHVLMPELAYTTVMTTLRRLADKGLLAATAESGSRAHRYRAAESPAAFLRRASTDEVGEVVARYGDAALAAFAARLADLTPEQRRRLEELRE